MKLTPREREILALVAEGLNNVSIAKRLWISRHTVEAHVAALKRKIVGERTDYETGTMGRVLLARYGWERERHAEVRNG